MLEELKAARNYVFNLKISGFAYPVDMKLVMAHLPVLNNLTIRYGPINVGMGN